MTAGCVVRLRGAAGRAETRRLAAGQQLAVGRDGDCGLVLPAREISRRHVTLTAAPGGVELEILSANGVLLDGQPLGPGQVGAPLPAVVGVGPYVLEIDAAAEERAESASLRRRVHRSLLDRLDLPRQDGNVASERLRRDVASTLGVVVRELAPELAPAEAAALVRALSDEVLGLGALEPLLADPAVTEIMVVDPTTIFVERAGRLERADATFSDAAALRAVIERIVTPIGRRIDESNPLVDARLTDGSRVNAVIPPLAVKGPCLTIRRFGERRITMGELVGFGSLSEPMARLLERSVRARRNIVVSGGTGSGKTTLLGALSAAIPEEERVVTVEDAAELRLAQEHVVTLEARPANVQGTGEVSIRDLVRNALRMRPDRILVGECRGGEALDMLQAMNTGHDGSMTTTHANSPREALSRLETLALMSGIDLPVQAIRRQIASSVHLVVQQSRFSDGSRRIVSVAEVTGLDDDGEVGVAEIYTFQRTGTGAAGQVQGRFRATGTVPSFVGELIARGVATEEDCL